MKIWGFKKTRADESNDDRDTDKSPYMLSFTLQYLAEHITL